jgi:glycosyltransferase involved in cell wall biosynthesis
MSGRAAILYAGDGFDTSGQKLMGRQAAGEGFLKAWVRYSGADPVVAWLEQASEEKGFCASVEALDPGRRTAVAGPANVTAMTQAGALWLPEPRLSRYAWLRRHGPQNAFSIVGITHTTASHAALDGLAELLVAPVQPWDAVICTSKSVRATVETLFALESEYLSARLGAQRFEGPQLPVIPLGVHCDDFETGAADRARWRTALGLAEDDIAVLTLGRLSFHGKAHPVPLYMALDAAAQRTGKTVHLILAGWFSDKVQENLFNAAASAFSARVRTHNVDGRQPVVRRTIWAAADIFTLLADNIQETFGLAPVEAMAAGLPVVVSDWDGFRDTVDHGGSGFRIPTSQPVAGAGAPLALRHDVGVNNYDHYIGSAAQVTGVDIAVAANRFASLIGNADLRRSMGVAARARAWQLFDWRVVLGQYLELLDDLAERRASAAGERAPRSLGAPARAARADPFRLFDSYPTVTLTAGTRLKQGTTPGPVETVPGGYRGAMPVRTTMPDSKTIDRILERIVASPVTIEALAQEVRGVDLPALIRAGAWLVKFGFAAIDRDPPPGA